MPFEFSWELGEGLHGVGSGRNLRGKSTVLEVILWALRGRNHVQADVAAYIAAVEVVFSAAGETITVSFTVTAGMPAGSVTSGQAQLAAFSNQDEFEAAMDDVMMSRLGLPIIPSFDRRTGRTEHAWPAYAGALAITVDSVGQIIGDIQFALGARLLQMFIGAPWATNRAQALSAQKDVAADAAEHDKRRDITRGARATQRVTAEAALESAKSRLATTDAPDIDLEAVTVAIARLGTLSERISGAETVRNRQQAALAALEAERDTEQRRRHQLIEDAVAVRFFNRHEPTMCPRCTSPVTADQRREEAAGHACSVCHGELDLVAFDADVLISTEARPDDRETAVTSARLLDGDEDDHTDVVDALASAIGDATTELRRLDTDLDAWRTQRDEALRAANAPAPQLAARRDAELAVARAQGAVDALGDDANPVDDDAATRQRDADILTAAADICGDRVRDAQRDALAGISERVTTLARSFGMDALSRVEMTGSPSMTVHKAGGTVSYGKCTRGEQLRLKVALAIALLHAAHETGIGRHPGLLLLDSPGAEELTDDNIDTMLHALADAAQGMQVITATTSIGMLTELLDQDHRKIATGDSYLW